MMKSAPKKVEKRVAAQSRSLALISKGNRKLDVPSRERVRPKLPPTRPSTRATKCALKNMISWRGGRTFDEHQIDIAIDTASSRYRQTLRERAGAAPRRQPGRGKPGAKTRNQSCAAKVFFPANFSSLNALIPANYRTKPTQQGQTCMYVPPISAPLQQWTLAVVERIAAHNSHDSNWVVVRKPSPCDGENPYLAIDSTCVWLAPVLNTFPTTLFKNCGVYVIFCARLKDYYVGESNDVQKRMADHDKGTVVWTRKWRGEFTRIAPITPRGGTYRQHETRETRALAEIHGWDHVRGGGVTSKSSTPKSSQASQ